MPHPSHEDFARLPKTLLRRKKQYRLRRRVYGEGPVPTDDRHALALAEQATQLLVEKRDWSDKAAQLQDMLLRARSDLENFRRRNQRDREETRTALTADLLSTFLPVLDHLELAVRAAQSSSDPSSILQGVLMIQRELQGVLQSLGLEKILTNGIPFDPAIHEAVATETRPDQEDRRVLEVLRPGWRFGDRCLRAAMVKVNRLEEPAPVNPPPP